MPVFKALSITEHHQKTPLTLLDYEEPTLKEGEFLLENAAVAQVSSSYQLIFSAIINISFAEPCRLEAD